MVDGQRYAFVVQKHRRFHDCGLRVARRGGVPFVLKIDALEVREEASWGVRRPLWGRIAEALGEVRLIHQADLVVPVSASLDAQLASLGVPPDQRLVLDNGVDLDHFSPGPPDDELRAKHDLGGRLVIGWVGSFRPFHGLALVPDIARMLRDCIPEAVLCLVGTGEMFDEISERIGDLRDTVKLVGAVPHDRIADWIRTFDICLSLADPGPYPYSPLKLYEYMGCGRPVVAAAVDGVAERLHGGGGILVAPGDAGAVVQAVGRLAAEPLVRERIGAEGRTTAERLGGWRSRAEKLINALRDRALL
jgi:glycosyltransferase involved in cell wall biosynthesis